MFLRKLFIDERYIKLAFFKIFQNFFKRSLKKRNLKKKNNCLKKSLLTLR